LCAAAGRNSVAFEAKPEAIAGMRMNRDKPIGVFDSGMGGLTVLSALRKALPVESFVYLGDTARLPYGTKSPETVTRYGLRAARALIEQNVKLLVVACNTASAVALPALEAAISPTPVLGVVEPGAEAAVRATKSGRVAVIATESTVRGNAYPRALRTLAPQIRVTQQACPLFVALAEEGWSEGEVARAAATRYLEPLFSGRADDPDTLILGCTHFPLLRGVIQEVCGPSVAIVDSAATTAARVATLVYGAEASPKARAKTRFLVTDAPERFARLGSLFLGERVLAADVALIDLPPPFHEEGSRA
jgi:glutamate racemase